MTTEINTACKNICALKLATEIRCGIKKNFLLEDTEHNCHLMITATTFAIQIILLIILHFTNFSSILKRNSDYSFCVIFYTLMLNFMILNINFKQLQMGDPEHSNGTIEKVKRKLNFDISAVTSLNAGLNKTIDYIRNERD